MSQTASAPASAAPAAVLAPLRSVHTGSFPPLLRQLGVALLVTTYQAGKLVVVRADGELLNTHFRVFPRPMGLAARPERLAIGTQRQVQEFRNMAAVAAKLEPPGKHDAAFLPRRSHVTGDIDIHEMDYAADGTLWLINTRFSCLCTLDAEHSFVPRWRPPFISAYAPSDRCHLNGLAMRDGRPRYVTALGTADSEQGWRARKADGGVLMDLDTNGILLEGLSMPHSPRWYQDRLWVLESGRGGIGWLDPATGQLHTLATLPGFTRGLDFAGPFAFVGVSQVRESATFSGIPLTRTLSERNCGVWVVDLRNGQIVAFLRFEGAVQEIFAVAVLPGIRFPDVINDDDEGLIGLTYALPDAALKESSLPTPRAQAQPHQDRGIAHHQAGELEQAAAAFREALAAQPDFLPARYNLGVTLNDLERFAEAVVELEQVVADEAAHADAQRALGFAYSQLRDIDAAIRHLRQAIAIRPDFAEAHLSLGLLLLMQGHFAEGWNEFDWRWRTPGFTPFDPRSHPRWDGTPLPAGTLLIHTEQGAGDAIQCLRFLPRVAARCRRLLLVAPPSLHPLTNGLAANLSVTGPGDLAADSFDAYLPIMSLPRVLGVHTESDIPAQVPYLWADPERLRLPPRRSGRRIGLVWAGSPTFINDRHRSIPLARLVPLLAAAPDLEWLSLQKGAAAAQRETLPDPQQLIDLDPLLNDYGDTAAALVQLDLLISVDTSVAHLAGALAVPTWLLLPANADWRWQVERSDSPWYPTLRLFRQPALGDWESVIAAVGAALRQWP